MLASKKTEVVLAYCGACGGRRGFRFPEPRTRIELLIDGATFGLWTRVAGRRMDNRRRHLHCTTCGTPSDVPISHAMVAHARVEMALVEGPIRPRYRAACWRAQDGRHVLVPYRQAHPNSSRREGDGGD